MSISTPKVKPVPGRPVRVATAVLAAVLALVLAGTTAAASADTTTEATASQDTMGAGISREDLQELRRVVATKWARLFAAEGCNRYMGGKLCARLVCRGKTGPIKNCTPMSAAFRKSFGDATVEQLIHSEGQGQFNGPRVAVKFSNGVLVVFAYDYYGREGWSIGLPNGRFIQAATG